LVGKVAVQFLITFFSVENVASYTPKYERYVNRIGPLE